MNKTRLSFTFALFFFLSFFVFVAFVDANFSKEKNYWQSKSKFPFDNRIDGLTFEEEDSFVIGRSFFTIPWVIAPSSTTARDGLGPLFNANTCTGCHFKRTTTNVLDEKGNVGKHLVFKLGKNKAPTNEQKSQPNWHDKNYGGQISISGTKTIPFEAKPNIKIKYKTVYMGKGLKRKKIRLRYFEPHLTQKNYGELESDTHISPRMAIVLVGLGLVQKIPDKQILEYAAAQNQNNNEISGKPNWVLNPQTGKPELGRFGHKASQSTVTMQTADAAFHDMSLTNPLFPQDNCTTTQELCLQAPKGLPTKFSGSLDMPRHRLESISFYLQSLKAPPPYNKEHEGFQVFKEIGCIGCHRADYQISENLHVHPFSDYLLHNMGEELADSRFEWEATSAEWRTAPLWGLSAKRKAGIPLLHDGRAEDTMQAILWHGGEAEKIKKRFMELTKQERETLIKFLETL